MAAPVFVEDAAVVVLVGVGVGFTAGALALADAAGAGALELDAGFGPVVVGLAVLVGVVTVEVVPSSSEDAGIEADALEDTELELPELGAVVGTSNVALALKFCGNSAAKPTE